MSNRTANAAKSTTKPRVKNTGSKSKTTTAKPKANAKPKTTAKTQKSMTLHFDREKETPGTIRFKEREANNGEVAVGTLYVKKSADKLLGSPKALKVTVEVA